MSQSFVTLSADLPAVAQGAARGTGGPQAVSQRCPSPLALPRGAGWITPQPTGIYGPHSQKPMTAPGLSFCCSPQTSHPFAWIPRFTDCNPTSERSSSEPLPCRTLRPIPGTRTHLPLPGLLPGPYKAPTPSLPPSSRPTAALLTPPLRDAPEVLPQSGNLVKSSPSPPTGRPRPANSSAPQPAACPPQAALTELPGMRGPGSLALPHRCCLCLCLCLCQRKRGAGPGRSAGGGAYPGILKLRGGAGRGGGARPQGCERPRGPGP